VNIEQSAGADVAEGGRACESNPRDKRNLKNWSLSPQAFDLLLRMLDADRERAGGKYEQLRRALVDFFNWRGCAFPEDLADETLNRAARRLEEGEPVRNVSEYCHGVARRLVFEVIPRQQRRREAPEEFAHPVSGEDEFERRLEREHRFEAFERCLERLSAEDRALILNYYQREKRARIDHRLILAQSLGISLNTLRVRVHRIRARLERCIASHRRQT
jgi:RNA polymerase sigma factor (sigma-70 family)